jgi:hypothetical protein
VYNNPDQIRRAERVGSTQLVQGELILRNNTIFTFGKADRATTSASLREILDAMWLFDDKFERALAKYNEIKARQRS